MAAALEHRDVGRDDARSRSQFYLNQARPCAVLTTDHALTQEQVQQLRAAVERADRRALTPGGTPILTDGLKPHRDASTRPGRRASPR